jgi:hypothetical protein
MSREVDAAARGLGSKPVRIAHGCLPRRRLRMVRPRSPVSVGDTQISIRGKCGFRAFYCSVASEPFPRTKLLDRYAAALAAHLIGDAERARATLAGHGRGGMTAN